MNISAIRQRIATALLTIPDVQQSSLLPEVYPSTEGNDTLVKSFAVHIPSWELYSDQRRRRNEPIDVVSPVEVKWCYPISAAQVESVDNAKDFELLIITKLQYNIETEGLNLILLGASRRVSDDKSYIYGSINCRAQYVLLTPI